MFYLHPADCVFNLHALGWILKGSWLAAKFRLVWDLAGLWEKHVRHSWSSSHVPSCSIFRFPPLLSCFLLCVYLWSRAHLFQVSQRTFWQAAPDKKVQGLWTWPPTPEHHPQGLSSPLGVRSKKTRLRLKRLQVCLTGRPFTQTDKTLAMLATFGLWIKTERIWNTRGTVSGICNRSNQELKSNARAPWCRHHHAS